MNSSGKIRIATIGSDSSVRALVSAAEQSSHFATVAAYDLDLSLDGREGSPAAGAPSLQPLAAKTQGSWESLLAGDVAACVDALLALDTMEATR